MWVYLLSVGGRTCCHVISRVNHGEFLLDDGEKFRFLEFLRDAESFCGADVVTFGLLDSHIHILLGIDQESEVPEGLVISRVRTR